MGLPRLDSLGNYELLMELAKGGMAELYLARIHGVGGFEKLVAIKRILPHLAEDKLFRDMFLNEGRIAARLSHQNICQVFHLDEYDGELFLIMEYLRGVSWDALVRELPRDVETLRLAAGVIAQACDGLHHAHELRDASGQPTPVIHRDVSPQNLFVTVDGVCKVLDFGVSKMAKDGPRTRTGVLKGKLPYMAPEQIQGEAVDARSDVFALGVVMWEALAGVALFDRDTDFLIWKAIAEAPIPPLAPHGFPPELDAVLGCALARPPEQRFRSARALGEALRHAAERAGGAYGQAEIAAVVAARHGQQIGERDRAVASYGAAGRGRRSEPSAADTVEDTAGSTVSLRADPAPTNVSPVDVSPTNASPVDVSPVDASPTNASPTNASMTIDVPPMRARWPYLVGVVVAAAGITALVLATRGGDDGRDATGAPVASAPVASAAVATPAVTIEAPVGPVGELAPMADASRLSSGGGSAAAPEAAAKAGRGSDKVGRRLSDARARLGATPYVPPHVIGILEGGTATPTAPVSRAPAPAGPATVEHGTYSIDSAPYATIYLDGAKLGDTPLFKLKVSPGKHVVRAVLADGRERAFPIEVAPGNHVNSGKLTWRSSLPSDVQFE